VRLSCTRSDVSELSPSELGLVGMTSGVAAVGVAGVVAVAGMGDGVLREGGCGDF
jgi:hypothetical protein